MPRCPARQAPNRAVPAKAGTPLESAAAATTRSTSACCTLVALGGVTAATLYQRTFAPPADLKAASVIQFAVSLALLAPLAFAVEDFRVRWAWQLWAAIAFLVILASILGVSVLYYLLRHGEATRVTSMMPARASP